MSVQKQKQSERDIQRTICDWLTLKRIFWYRQNSGAMAGTHNGKRRFFRFGWPGAPDIIAVIDGRYVGIEVKSTKGCQSQAQFHFQKSLEKAGARYILARSIEDVERGLFA